jgi:hypothetical protein
MIPDCLYKTARNKVHSFLERTGKSQNRYTCKETGLKVPVPIRFFHNFRLVKIS